MPHFNLIGHRAAARRAAPGGLRGSPLGKLFGNLFGIVLAAAAAPVAWAAPPAPQAAAERHAQALQAFRQGRVAEAYGRFVALADGGHPVAARHALWLCEHGLEQFGHDWDCGPQQVALWSRLAATVAPRLPSWDAVQAPLPPR